MKTSPFILSAVLHLVIGPAIWHYGGIKPVVRPPVFYVNLAAFDAGQQQVAPEQQTEPAREPGQAEPAEQPDQNVLPDQNGNQDPAAQPDPAQPGSTEPEPAQPEPAAGERGMVQAGEPGTVPAQPRQAQVAPEISRAFAGAWHAQEMMFNTRRYQQVAGLAVRQVLEGKLTPAGRARLNGAKVQIVASYDTGAAPAFSVKTENEELRALLQDQSAWTRIPSPKECKVRYNKVAFLVSLERGTIQVGLSPQ